LTGGFQILSQLFAKIIRTLFTASYPFNQGAGTYLAKVSAIDTMSTFIGATHAIDIFFPEGVVKEFAPFICHCLTHIIVIGNSGKVGIAHGAIYSTGGI